jgi:hypothetical protein
VFIIAVMSVSLVAFFTSDYFAGGSGGGRSRGQPDLGSINGQPIAQAEYFDAWKEVRLANFLHSGKWPGNDETSSRRMESETISRVFLIHKLREMDIQASDKAVALMMHEQLHDYPYATLEKEILEPNGLKAADYERFLRNEAAIRQLIAAASVSSRLVDPTEAETIWRKENQEVNAQLAVFWTSNFLDKVVVTNGATGNFYTNRMGFYRLPERLIVSYIDFQASNYLAEADSKLAKLTNLNDIVSEYYFRAKGGTNAWTDTNGAPLPEAAAKEKIKEEIRMSQALDAARRAASELGNQLITQPEPNKVDNFEKLAAAKGLQVKTTKPFDSRTNGLEEFEHEESLPARSEDAPRESFREIFRQQAFSLTDERPIRFSPIPSKTAVYLIARKSKLPSELQPLDKIQEKVAADYKNFMALELVRKAGQSFQTNLTNGLTLKKSFDELCAEAKVQTMDLPLFSPSTTALTNLDARINLRLLQGVASELDPGKASSFVSALPASEGGFIIYVKSHPPIDDAKMKAALPEFLNQLRVYRQNEAFQQWFRKQAELARVAGPKREPSVSAPN